MLMSLLLTPRRLFWELDVEHAVATGLSSSLAIALVTVTPTRPECGNIVDAAVVDNWLAPCPFLSLLGPLPTLGQWTDAERVEKPSVLVDCRSSG